jgi:alcohol dehydrogenase (cytochrome c)
VCADGATGRDWPSYGGTHASWRYSSLDQINTSNVSHLAPVWVFQTADYENGLQATPIVVDGVLYLSTSNNYVVALDGATGRLLWEYRFPFPKGFQAPYTKQNRGVAVGHGRVFMGTSSNHLVALDQKTGDELWRVSVQDVRQCGCSITAAPLVVKDMVITGVAGGDSAHRGYLTAFDVKTGRLRWRFYTIPAPGEKGHETWPGDSWKFGGGATWMTGSYDPDLDLLYWGVGNPAADLNASKRRGDNLYTDSIIALNPDTGQLKWHYQEVPQDVWDYDSVFEQILVDVPFRGRTRKVMLHPNKAGYIWMLDRETGECLKVWPFAENINWVKGITEDGKFVGRVEPEAGKSTSVCPSAVGAKNWNQSAYSQKAGLLIIPVIEACNDIVPEEQEAVEGKMFIGGKWTFHGPGNSAATSSLTAFDAASGQRKWSFPASTLLLASVLATAGNLVFTGEPDGNFFAVDAATGKKLWSFPTGGGHRGSSVTYSVNGRQYIATPSGWGSVVGAVYGDLFPKTTPPRAGSALFVFALPEEAKR